ncbi:hypothetical protein Nepgr_012386 [Nepenthes gracilis]|uniref:Uncharacterized protein n=1 Tax=Nepenthes gracilis TaxID=150966 RepID=A0AAD3XNB0_NEPGR|nr:hypothetical protein Nepgr_012386 [Nepenthes gracilis]
MPASLTKFFTQNCPKVATIMDSENVSGGCLQTATDLSKASVPVPNPTLQGLNDSDLTALVVDHTSDAVSHNKGKPPLLFADALVQPDAKLENKKSEAPVLFRGYYEWKQAVGLEYGDMVAQRRLNHFIKKSPHPSSICKVKPLMNHPMIMNPRNTSDLSSFSTFLLRLLMKSPAKCKALSLLFDRFGLHILAVYLIERNGIADFPLNAMVIDTAIRR